MGTRSEGEKTLGISHKWGREEDSAGPQGLQVQQEGLIHYFQRHNYNLIRETEADSDLTVFLNGLCQMDVGTRQFDRGGSSVSHNAEAHNWRRL